MSDENKFDFFNRKKQKRQKLYRRSDGWKDERMDRQTDRPTLLQRCESASQKNEPLNKEANKHKT